jgi:hypothetical protein
VLPAVTLFVPLLVIAVIAYALAGTSTIHTQARPSVFALPAANVLQRAGESIRAATVPEEYRSILNLKALEVAAAGGSPVLWLTALVALGFAVTR